MAIGSQGAPPPFHIPPIGTIHCAERWCCFSSLLGYWAQSWMGRHSDTLSRNLTRECYPVVSLLSSKIGGPEGFAQILSSDELPCEGKLHRRYSHGVGFQIFFCFENVVQNEGFYGGRSANPATNLLLEVPPLQEDVRKHSWALDMDGRWLTRSSSTL